MSLQSLPTLCNPVDCSPLGSSPWASPGKNTAMGCHGLLSRGFSHPEIKPASLTSPACTGRFFTTSVTCKFHRAVKTLVSFLHTVSEGKKYSRLDYQVVRFSLGSVLNSLQFPEAHSPATLLMGSSL